MSIRPDDDEIFDLGAFEHDGPVHEILEGHGSFGYLESHGTRHTVALAGRDLLACQPAAGAIVAPRRSGIAGVTCGVASGFQLFGRAIAVVRVAFGHEPPGHLPMTVESLGLKVRAMWPANERSFVPIETEPSQTVENALQHFRRGALGIRILDSENEDTTVTTRKQPVEQRGTGAADVQVAGRRGSETDAWGHGQHGLCLGRHTLRLELHTV